MFKRGRTEIADREALESIFKKYGFDDFKWINPKDVVVSQWVRMKCMFGQRCYIRTED